MLPKALAGDVLVKANVGIAAAEPPPADANGAGSGGEATGTTPSFVEFNRYDSIDFNNLNLGPF